MQIRTITKEEKLEHTGDLTVQNVGKQAIVDLLDSEFIVKDNVEEKAKIRLTITKQKKTEIGSASIGTLKGRMISTEGVMVKLGNHHSIISSKDGGRFTATIDNQLYKANTKIELKDKNIFVDGILQSENIEQKKTGSLKPRISIHGSILDGVIIDSDKEIEVKQDIGENCQLTSTNSSIGIRAKKVGNYTIIKAYGKILADCINHHCHLTSSHYGIILTNIGDDAKISADMDIIVKGKMGERCILESKTGNVEIHGIAGNKLTVTAHNKIQVHIVGNEATLISKNASVTAHTLGTSATVLAEDEITITAVCPADAKLLSTSGEVIKPDIDQSLEKFSIFSLKPQEEKDPIKSFRCPITKEFMIDPVIYKEDGLTYDRSAIETRLKEMGYKENDMSNLLTSNEELNKEGAKYLELHTDLADALFKKHKHRWS